MRIHIFSLCSHCNWIDVTCVQYGLADWITILLWRNSLFIYDQLKLYYFFWFVHISVHTQVQLSVPARRRASSCITFTNSGRSHCDHTSARDCINDASRFDAVRQTDYPALNPLLNPACHTKASCTPTYQCKHLFTLIPLHSQSLLHKWKDTFILSRHRHSHWKQAGLEKVNSSVRAYTSERGRTSSSYVH